ncbi:MAG: TlpA disulfide reductase family protein [Candidatus Velthaea sp.]|jgi:peroxiredoxin
MRSIGTFAGVIVGVLLLSGCYGGGGTKRTFDGVAAGPRALTGAPAVSFDVPSLAGVTDSLASYRGKIVVMNLWATWCPPCKAEMPDLQRLWTIERAKGVVVLGVDQGESSGAVRAFTQRYGVTFPVLLDADQQYGRAYAALGLPTTVVVDRSGHIVAGIDGLLTLAQMRQAIAPVLAKR